jgi:chaperonin GroES
MPMNIQPLYDRLVVKRIEQEMKTASGLILTTEDKSNNVFIGTVLAIGGGTPLVNGETLKMRVKVNDTIMFNGQVQAVKDEDGQELFIMKESNVIAITN